MPKVTIQKLKHVDLYLQVYNFIWWGFFENLLVNVVYKHEIKRLFSPVQA